MCGRYSRKEGDDSLIERIGLARLRDITWNPSYNVAPTTAVPVVRDEKGQRIVLQMRWGLIPSWAKPDAKLPLLSNARAETVASKPAFRSSFKSRRCIVPASGYYEWKKLPDGTKQPFYFERADGFPMAFAAVWEPGNDSPSVATITTTPNAEAAPVHDRMPVILEGLAWARWLDPEPLTDSEQKQFLAPSPDGTLTLWPVDRRVGSVRNNDPHLIDRLDGPLTIKKPIQQGDLF